MGTVEGRDERTLRQTADDARRELSGEGRRPLKTWQKVALMLVLSALLIVCWALALALGIN